MRRPDVYALAEKLRDRFPDLESAQQFAALIDEVLLRRSVDTPTGLRRLARLIELRQLNANLMAREVPLARRVEALEGNGMSRAAAYRLASQNSETTESLTIG